MEVVKSTCGFGSIDDDEVVGFEEDAKIIMKKLTGGTKELEVLSIFGMAGLGKTTLARKVYKNPCIVGHFDVKLWCAVSQTYDRTMLMVELFNQATDNWILADKNIDIADKLQKVLKGKRYLIVLDDIWEAEAWDDLRLCFPEGEYGSRVIITSRIEEVAAYVQRNPYSLRFLTLEESWELLEKKVFQGESCPVDLLEAGLQVAKHCEGLPLVIVLIAGIIKDMKREVSTWMEIASDLSSYVLGEQTMKVIQSSYDHLEDHLKHCLSYMALFPEDRPIIVSDLIMWWMGEEFVLNVDKENMEEASRSCLKGLFNRSLVMVYDREYNGEVTRCILHDVVREFCLRKLTEETFMQLKVPYNPYKHSYSMESRLSIYIHEDLVKQLDHYEYQLDKIPMLKTTCLGECPRTLEFIAHPTFYTWKGSNPFPLLEKLRLFRVLILTESCLPSSWASAVQSLTHLRYLEIYVEEFDFKWISHLLNLQTLVVYSNSNIRTSPGAIWKMTKLRRVQIDRLSLVWEDNDNAVSEENSSTTLENLKIFNPSGISVYNTTPRFWWRFPVIEKLRFRIKESPSCPLFPTVEVHTQLKSLHLLTTSEALGDSVGWESYCVLPSNIRCLNLRGCFLTKGMVSNIAKLPKLEELTIFLGFPWEKSENNCWDVSDVTFPSLKYLALESVKMKEWEASEESFPVLENLFLRGCSYFKEIPLSFAEIPTLQEIKLYHCVDSLEDSAMNIKREIEENTGFDTFQVDIRQVR